MEFKWEEVSVTGDNLYKNTVERAQVPYGWLYKTTSVWVNDSGTHVKENVTFIPGTVAIVAQPQSPVMVPKLKL